MATSHKLVNKNSKAPKPNVNGNESQNRTTLKNFREVSPPCGLEPAGGGGVPSLLWLEANCDAQQPKLSPESKGWWC
jgi:hypothetical protein